MSIRERKYFADPQAGLNSDDDAFAVGINEWVNAENIRSGSSDKYATGVVQGIGSNLLLNDTFASVKIGTQEWQGKNLDVITYQNGDPIPLVTDPTAWANLTTGAYCYVDDDSANTNTYGLLYNWYAINDPRGLAPIGWRIPSQTDYQDLGSILGGILVAGGKMKETGLTHWNTPNTGATNTSLFTGLGTGFRGNTGDYVGFKDFNFFWTNTPDSSTPGGVVNQIQLTSGGSGYTPGYYTNVSTSGGSGTDLTVDIYVGDGVFGAYGVVWFVYINNPGINYNDLDTIDIDGISYTTRASLSVTGVTNANPSSANCALLSYDNEELFLQINPSECGFSVRLIKDNSYITLGSTEDEVNNRLLYFLLSLDNSSEDRIMCYDITTSTTYNVLFDSQVIDGLSFNKNFPIHSAKVMEELLVWTDNNGEPRCININAGIKLNHPSYVTNTEAYSLPIKYETTTLIKRPPIYPLVAKKVLTGESVNIIKDNSYQFCYRYTYKDDQVSALSVYSILIPPNLNFENANAIDVQVPTNEYIDDDIEIVEICAKYGNDGVTKVVHKWSKHDTDDANSIIAHNNGTPLSFVFNDSNIAYTLDKITAATPFDNVPLKSEALELAKNRVFLGNNLIGYDTPVSTSLEAAVVNIDTTGGGTISGVWNSVELTVWSSVGNVPGQVLYSYTFPYVLAGGNYYYFPNAITQNPSAWNWTVTNPPTAHTFPTLPIINYYSQVATGLFAPPYFTNIDDLVTYLKSAYPRSIPSWNPGYTNNTTSLGATTITNYSSSITNAFFKSSSRYSVSVAFYDRFRRKCGIVTEKIYVDTAKRTQSQILFNDHISWNLDNTNALTEIPNWAYYYQIHITKNLSTRFFQQAKSYQVRYVTRNTDLTLNYVQNSSFPLNCYAIAIDISYLASYGLGYTFETGDYCNLIYTDGINNILLTRQIIGQDGNFILVQPYDLGISGIFGINILTFYPIFEIFTPFISSDIEPYFETGNLMRIINPATDDRIYGVLNGLLYGDTYALQRLGFNNATYIAEAMSPNDAVWKIWDTDTGWANYFTRLGQTRKTNSIKFSDTFIAGSKVNGINKFLFGNEKALDLEMGTLRKLQLSSKVQGEIGSVMLGICEGQTASLYIGETQQYGSSSQTTLTLSTDVIGSINVLKGSFGTVNPESVSAFKGNVYWLDARNGKFIQYSPNGLFPISSKKMSIFWKQFSQLYLSTDPTVIEEFGYRPFIFTEVDPHHFELVISIPQLSASPTNGYTPDYESMVYPFNIWDGQAKTIVYSLINDTWRGSYSFCTENFITSSNSLYSFNKGLLYLHNQEDSFNNFYGVQNSSKIMFVSNMQPNAPKVYDNIMIEGNLKPNFVYFYNNYPYIQTSDLIDTDFRDYEGLHNAVILRNKIVPTVSGYTTDGLLTGEYMRNVAMYCMTQWDISDTQLLLKFATIGFAMSRGYEQK